METQKRNHFVDVLKGICIIFVIFTHASWTDEQRVKLLFPFWIDMAVPFFMLVSGYVYTKSFQKNGIETLDSAYNKKYLLKNLIRYTIPYFIAFMIDFCVQVFLYIRNPTVMKRFFVHEKSFLTRRKWSWKLLLSRNDTNNVPFSNNLCSC